MDKRNEQLLGYWRGNHGGASVTIQFNPDGTAVFCNEPGFFKVDNSGLYPILSMTFNKEGLSSFTTTNVFSITDGGDLLLDTERGALLLSRSSKSPRVTLTSPPPNSYSPPIPQMNVGSVLKQNIPMLREYDNDYWGVHFSLPPTWFYTVTGYVPTVLSCLVPGLMYMRFHRPYTEAIRRLKYIEGYTEGHLFFEATLPDMLDVANSQNQILNRKKISFGDYIEKNASLLARAITISSVFGDCILIMGVCSDDQNKFTAMTNAMSHIAHTVRFEKPNSPSAFECLPGRYINQSFELLELFHDLRFRWSCHGEVNAKYGTGTWNRAGNDLEGELMLKYDNLESRKIRFLCVDSNRSLQIEDTVYRKMS
jgi:hypothetical protein